MFRAPIPENDNVRVAALHRYAILDSEREQAYDDVTALACYICEAPFSTITLVDRDRQWFKSEIGLGTQETGRSDGLCANAILQSEITVIEDTLQDPRFCQNPFVLGGPQIRFYAGAPLLTPDGFVLGTVCVFDTLPRSISTRQIAALEALARQVMAHMELRLRMLEGERQAQALRTAEKLAAVGRMASSMAHEINNPLQSVTNLLFMTDLAVENGTAKTYLAEAQEELGRVTHIVTQALRFHQQSERAVPTRLGELVESVVALFRTRVRHASADIVIEDSQTELLTCYASDLRQVLANLLGNALDAVSHGQGGRICFRMRDTRHVRTGEPGLRLTVSDNGEGMDAETRAKLFEPFFSTKGARGTGLGLWVSRGILDKHGAHVRVRSSATGPGRGTAFTIFFPLQFSLPKTGAAASL